MSASHLVSQAVALSVMGLSTLAVCVWFARAEFGRAKCPHPHPKKPLAPSDSTVA